MVVAIALGRNGIDLLLVLSQVILSLVLPFITLPLLYLTTSKAVMRVRKPPRDSGLCTKSTELDRIQVTDTERALDTVDFSNNILMAGLGYAIWLVMVAADVYVMINFGGLDIRDTNSEP
jgi:metal iron transporter